MLPRIKIGLGISVVALAIGFGLWWWLAEPSSTASAEKTTRDANRRVLYYRNPMGEPDTSPVPKRDSMGMDYIPVYADEVSHGLRKPDASPSLSSERHVLYYRNPMGLADTSPVPKKDSMGMDYIPVYAEESGTPGSIRVSLDKLQRLGVRSEPATQQVLNESTVLTGTLTADERKESIISLKFKANIVKLHAAATGERVHLGQPLFEIHSPFLLQQEVSLAIALNAQETLKELGGVYARTNARSESTARARLELYEVPEAEIQRLIRTHEPSGHVTWRATHDGTIMEKPVVAGMHADEGTPLYRIADLSTIWVIAEAPEQALAIATLGATAKIKVIAFPGKTFTGKVSFIYPEVSMVTRTVKVRIELANSERILIPGMFASVELSAVPGKPVLTVPENALIDSGQRQVLLIARGEGLFEPREVFAGRHAGGRVEILSGLKEGENVVTSATFLIDAESNLRAALQVFTADENSRKDTTR